MKPIHESAGVWKQIILITVELGLIISLSLILIIGMVWFFNSIVSIFFS